MHGDYPKMDLSDIVRRPFSSQLGGQDWYMKRDEYPKFPHSGSTHQQPTQQQQSPDENMSLNDDGSGKTLFKLTRNDSQENDPDQQNESKI